MSRHRSRSDAPRPIRWVEPSHDDLCKTHPTSMRELHKLIKRGYERQPQEGDFNFWMDLTARWKNAADAARTIPESDPPNRLDREWLYVCCARTAFLIYEKVLAHPDVNDQLEEKHKDILQLRGRRLVEAVAVLIEERKRAYDAWQAAEILRAQQADSYRATLNSVLSREESQDKPLPSVPAVPPAAARAESNALAIQTQLPVVSPSMPGSPIVADAKGNILLGPPSRGNSPPRGSDDPPPPYTERARYDEVMRDIMEDGDSPVHDMDGDGGSDYNIRVIEPDASSTRAVTPQMSPEILPPLVDEKGGMAAGLRSRGRASSRSSSIKEKSRSRSGSAQGAMRVMNPSPPTEPVPSEEDTKFEDAEKALEEAYRQLALLRKGGVRELPSGVRKRIDDLRVFLV